MPTIMLEVPYSYAQHYDSIMGIFEDIYRQPILGMFALSAFPNWCFDKDCVRLIESSGCD